MDEAATSSARSLRSFEDFAEGSEIELGSFSLSEEEIIGFAKRYDPQPFHSDPEGARNGPFGGLIASGWQTAASLMRLYVDAVLEGSDSRGSPGVQDLRWLRPVRPGDVISAKVTVLEARVSSTTEGRGTLLLRWEARNGDGEVVATMVGRGLFGTRGVGS